MGRGEAGDDPAVPQGGCLHINPALLEWRGDRLRCHQGAATSKGERKDTEYTEEANFSCEFNLSS